MASNSEPSSAWLETPDGQKTFLARTCSVGRSSANDLVLKNDRVSRKHALIHTQDKNEYWLVDFGSSNGTMVNGRRVTQPTRLRDNDTIEIADIVLRFSQKKESHKTTVPRFTARSTSYETRTANCWLLLADIVSSTRLTEIFPEKEVPALIGKWFLDCKQIIEANGGTINKFLGDGFFAYWEDENGTAEALGKAISQFQEVQKNATPSFRVVVHYGEVSIGGTPLIMQELMGRAVNFCFRMEKLAAKVNAVCLVSAPAKKRLPEGFKATSIGDHSLVGFDGDFHFYSL